ncbi:MAG: Gfo/Idh/MocA family oxidoreductase [Chloroflexi bacterium]|nr:Gfo/Idh/MocA family oxidoreductase [Chloroflexota bacterium]
MGETIGIGIVGAGGIAEHAHVPAYLQQPDARLVAIADVVPERARALAEKNGIPRAYGSLEELLLDPDVDAVSITTPNAYHAPTAIAALEAGKHVFCEKPPATTAAEVRRMRAVAERAGKVLYFCFNNRFRPDVLQLRRYVEAGELGEIYHAKTATLRRRGAPGGWFASKEIAGGGALIDIGVHCIDWTLWIMGSPRPVEIFGITHSKIKRYDLIEHRTWSPPEVRGQVTMDRAVDVEDMATALIRFATGATLFVEVSWSLNLEQDREYTEVFGTRAGASFRPLRLFRDEYGRMVNLEVRLPEHPGPSGHARAVRNFLDVLQGKAAPVVTPEDGVRIMEILDGIYASAEQGRSITIPDQAADETLTVRRT